LVLREFYPVPISLEHQDPQLALVGERTSSLRVRVRARETVIQNLSTTDIEARLDMSSFAAGQISYRFRPDMVRVPPEVDVVEVEPELLTFRLEPRVSRSLPVEATVKGNAAPGYEIKRTETLPPRVTVEGPQSAVEALQLAQSDPISINGRSASFSVEVQPHVDHPDVRVIGLRRVTVRVVIEELTDERVFEAVPIVSHSTPFVSQLAPDATDVTVEGPRSVVAALTPEDIEARVNLAGLEPARRPYRKPLDVGFRGDKPDTRLRIKSLSRDSVDVRVLNRRLDSMTEEGTQG
jgi:YbbR domain-containing protein